MHFGRHALAWLVVALAVVASASAQGTKKEKEYKKKEIQKVPSQRPINGNDFTVPNMAQFEAYECNRYLYPMTDPQYVYEIPDKRKILKKEFMAIRGPVNPNNPEMPSAAYDALCDIVIREMKQWIQDDGYHPAVRVNAILILGELSSTVPPPGAGNRFTPLPHPAALPILLELIPHATGDIKEGKKFPVNPENDAVRAAALVALHRYAQLETDPERRNQILLTVARLVIGDKEPNGRTAAVHDWLRRTGAEVLGELHMAGTTPGRNEAVKALLALLSDQTAGMSSRCEAARALGRIDLAGAGVTLKSVLPALVSAVVDASSKGPSAADTATRPEMFGSYGRSLSLAFEGDGAKTRGLINVFTSGAEKKELDLLLDSESEQGKRLGSILNTLKKGGRPEAADLQDLRDWLKTQQAT